MGMSTYQVVIVGAGPYGLAAAAHLRSAGIETRVFGEPMEFWQCQMPKGMFLRSSWEASHISDPVHALTLDAYQQVHGIQVPTPVPLKDFITYGKWFQGQVTPDVDRRRVARIELGQAGFRLLLEDGEVVEARRVVVAGGIAPFAYRPERFAGLPATLVSHSSEHSDLGRFAGQKVVVVGGGQSAIESAALLHEDGADVEVVVRAPKLRWLRRSAWLHGGTGPIRRLLYPPTDVGPPVLNQIVARPELFKRLPLAVQERVAYRSIRPAAAGWLWPRIGKVQITAGRNVTAVTPSNGGLRLALDDGTERRADHVLLATGFQVDVAKYPFLAPELVRSLIRVDGYPLLDRGFESSVPRLHFLGAVAAWSFGPLMRFVSGTPYSARALTRAVLGAGTDHTNGG